MLRLDTPFLPPLIASQLRGFSFQRMTIGRSSAGTWRCTYRGHDEFFLKVMPKSDDPDPGKSLAAERDRLLWLSSRLPVPKVQLFLEESGIEYLLTTALPGIHCAAVSCEAEALHAIPVLLEALRLMHGLPTGECPFEQGARSKLLQAKERIGKGLVDEEDFCPENCGRSATDIYDHLSQTIPSETMVASHGDFCLPNVIMKDGDLSGFIDVGRFGVADIYQDLSPLIRSCNADYNPFFKNVSVGKHLEELMGEVLDESKLQWFKDLDELF